MIYLYYMLFKKKDIMVYRKSGVFGYMISSFQFIISNNFQVTRFSTDRSVFNHAEICLPQFHQPSFF